MKHIFFDFNGTLLDDREVSLNVLNTMLAKRNLPLVTLAKYLSEFGFPVHEYYAQVGFDLFKEDFQDLSAEFISGYQEAVSSSSLFADVKQVLLAIKARGYRLVVLSASEKNMLIDLLMRDQIFDCFDSVLGLDNIYAHGKTQLAQQYLQEQEVEKATTYFIGDTVHDDEVAKLMGVECILVAQGHQNKNRLLATGSRVVDRLVEIMEYLT